MASKTVRLSKAQQNALRRLNSAPFNGEARFWTPVRFQNTPTGCIALMAYLPKRA